MRAVVQRVSSASVKVDNDIVGSIAKGYMILLGIEESDTKDDLTWLSNKIVALRIFNDEAGKMNLDLEDVSGEVLVISQFTLHAKTKKGTRPSYIKAARPEMAIPMYEHFIEAMGDIVRKPVQSGVFAADMAVSLVNDGPVTILLDTKNKE